MEKLQIVNTSDQSKTLYVPDLDEHYHSHNGAIQESVHVFIHAGLSMAARSLQNITVYEVGFGTGLNALLTLKFVLDHPELKVRYVGIERFPLSIELVHNLEYDAKENNFVKGLFTDMHMAPWNTEVEIHPRFKLTKMERDFNEANFELHPDLVYFDAFAPDKQSEMWEEEHFQKIYKDMNLGGILVTYCAKGEVRRRMQRSGFKVERLPGPPGKREMIRAMK